MPSAQRRQIAFTGTPAAVVGHSVVQVAAICRAAAAGECTPLLAQPDQVLQRQRWPVATGLPLVGTSTGLQPLQRHACHPRGSVSPGRPGQPAPRPGAAVSDGAAVAVGHGEAPPGSPTRGHALPVAAPPGGAGPPPPPRGPTPATPPGGPETPSRVRGGMVTLMVPAGGGPGPPGTPRPRRYPALRPRLHRPAAGRSLAGRPTAPGA